MWYEEDFCSFMLHWQALQPKDTSCFKDCLLSGEIGNNLHTTAFGVHHKSAQQKKDIEIDKNYSKRHRNLFKIYFHKIIEI